MNKTVTLTPDEVETAAYALEQYKNGFDEEIIQGSYTQTREEEAIGIVRTAESILKKLGEK
jgi:hypothetical protein